MQPGTRGPPRISPAWLNLLHLLAAAKAGGGMAVFLCGRPLFETAVQDGYFPLTLHLLLIASFSLVGGWLALSGRGGSSAGALGSALLVVSTSYANWPLAAAGDLLPELKPWIGPLRAVHVDAFLPFFLWRFARAFPSVTPEHRRWVDLTVGVAAAAGWAFFLLGALAYLVVATGTPSPTVAAVAAVSPRSGLFYSVVLVLTAMALGFLGSKVRAARGAERRRVTLFILALMVGFGPVLLATVGSLLIPAVDRFFAGQRRIHAVLQPFLAATLLSLPFTTAYAVLVQRVIGLKLLARRVVQHLLARLTVGIVTAIPLAVLALYLHHHRSEPLEDILAGRRLILLTVATAVGLAALRYRHHVLDWIDRRFFREQHDARRLLAELVDRIRNCTGPRELAQLLVVGIDRALHLANVALLLNEPSLGLIADPLDRVRPLDASAPVARLVARSEDPLEVDPDDPRDAATRFPDADRQWLNEGGFRLLVPLSASDGSLLGLLALGEKKSGLPYLREDQELLRTIGASAALGIEVQRFHASREGSESERREMPAVVRNKLRPGLHRARECPACGRLHLPRTEVCSRCGQRLSVAGVPYILPGRFRFEERIGEGGMGVVYRAIDLALGRPVAVKTLRDVSPEHALQLRREAQTAAAVSHPNLAFVYGLETWHGTPLLIMEFLEGGTLADRIRGHPFAATEVLGLGLDMARALQRLHEEEILHGDLKPSNIGFSADHVPKLMDFGIARLLFDPRGDRALQSEPQGERHLPPTSIWHGPSQPASEALVGTLAYMPPEVVSGGPLDAAVDLWGLALVLYECLLGGHLFPDPGPLPQAAEVVRRRIVPDIRRWRSDCPQPLAELLSRSLDRRRDQRPKTAVDFLRSLERIRRELGDARPAEPESR